MLVLIRQYKSSIIKKKTRKCDRVSRNLQTSLIVFFTRYTSEKYQKKMSIFFYVEKKSTLSGVVLIGKVGEIVATLEGFVERRQGSRRRRARPVVTAATVTPRRHAARTRASTHGTAAAAASAAADHRSVSATAEAAVGRRGIAGTAAATAGGAAVTRVRGSAVSRGCLHHCL